MELVMKVAKEVVMETMEEEMFELLKLEGQLTVVGDAQEDEDIVPVYFI